jgi:WD40 repeat protein
MGFVVTLVLTVIALIFGTVSYFKSIEAQKSQSLFLADLSRQQTEQGNATTGILLALEALPQNMNALITRPYVAEAEHSLYAALSHPREEYVLLHESWLNSAKFSSDGKKAVTASGDNTAQIWSVATGQRLAILQGHEDSVIHAEFSLDSQKVITASRDNTAKIWKVTGGTFSHFISCGFCKSCQI